jgi:hypothetical protein
MNFFLTVFNRLNVLEAKKRAKKILFCFGEIEIKFN